MKLHASRQLFPLCLAALLGGCVSTPPEIKNTVGMDFVLISKGNFIMGCGDADSECLSDEKPQHPITLTKPFYLGKYPVTQAQWTAIMGSNPSSFKGNKLPVENVSWHDAQEFIRRLNALEGTDKYRLPTEAEWEYAARAGISTKYPFDPSLASKYAWYWNNSNERTHPVGEKQPNPWGVGDMLGLVWEWTQDWYNEHWYEATLESYANANSKSKGSAFDLKGATSTDPTGPAEGSARVLRGGSWSSDLRYIRAPHRNAQAPNYKHNTTGFRLLIVPDSDWVRRVQKDAEKKAEQQPANTAPAQRTSQPAAQPKPQPAKTGTPPATSPTPAAGSSAYPEWPDAPEPLYPHPARRP